MKLWIFIIAELQQVRSSFGLIVYNAAGCIIWILPSQEFTGAKEQQSAEQLKQLELWKNQTCPLYGTRGVLWAPWGVSSKWRGPWHSHSSPTSTRCWEGTALACVSFLPLRSYFSCVPEKFMVPAQHLPRLNLFWSRYPNCAIPMLTLYCRQETWAHPRSGDWINGIFLIIIFIIIFLIISNRHFYTLIWLIFLTSAKHRGNIFREICND